MTKKQTKRATQVLRELANSLEKHELEFETFIATEMVLVPEEINRVALTFTLTASKGDLNKLGDLKQRLTI